jgi:hypothetical protein
MAQAPTKNDGHPDEGVRQRKCFTVNGNGDVYWKIRKLQSEVSEHTDFRLAHVPYPWDGVRMLRSSLAFYSANPIGSAAPVAKNIPLNLSRSEGYRNQSR